MAIKQAQELNNNEITFWNVFMMAEKSALEGKR